MSGVIRKKCEKGKARKEREPSFHIQKGQAIKKIKPQNLEFAEAPMNKEEVNRHNGGSSSKKPLKTAN